MRLKPTTTQRARERLQEISKFYKCIEERTTTDTCTAGGSTQAQGRLGTHRTKQHEGAQWLTRHRKIQTQKCQPQQRGGGTRGLQIRQ